MALPTTQDIDNAVPITGIPDRGDTNTVLKGLLQGISDNQDAIAPIQQQVLDGLNEVVSYVDEWDASTGSFPNDSGNPIASRGNIFSISADGTIDGISFYKDEIIIALVDNASTTTYVDNWLKLSSDQSAYQLLSWSTETGNTFTIPSDASGECYFLTGLTANCTVTLPAYSSVGEGWNCSVVVDGPSYLAGHVPVFQTQNGDVILGDMTGTDWNTIFASPTANQFIISAV